MKTRFILFIYTLLLSLSVFGQTQPHFQPGVEFLIDAEQHRISRDLDDRRIYSPHENKQDKAYTPETGAVFEIKSYWVDASALHGFFSDNLSPAEKELWTRTVNGVLQYRFLVHPESESLYENFLKSTQGVQQDAPFLATATSSSRTLLVWPEGQPEKAFFGKLSLNKQIGGVVRTIPISETSRSVGTTNVLQAESASLPKDFGFFPEIFGAIPKGMDRGGMIIRQIPPEVAAGKKLAIPLFALYGQTSPDTPPLLAKLINESGMNPKDFIRLKIIRPFVQQWIRMESEFGITMEPHAQNVLIGLTPEMKLDGNFYHRDFGGFGLDLAYRKKIGRPLPKLPTVQGVDRDYHQVSEDKAYHMALPRSLALFFSAGFLYNLDKKLPEWEKKNWINKSRSRMKSVLNKLMFKTELNFEQILAEEVNMAIEKKSRGQVHAEGKPGSLLNEATLLDQLRRLRQVVNPIMLAPVCAQIFN